MARVIGARGHELSDRVLACSQVGGFNTRNLHEWYIVDKLNEAGFTGFPDILKDIVVDPRPKKMEPKHYYDELMKEDM